jgi:hypothetical protein
MNFSSRRRIASQSDLVPTALVLAHTDPPQPAPARRNTRLMAAVLQRERPYKLSFTGFGSQKLVSRAVLRSRAGRRARIARIVVHSMRVASCQGHD